MTTNKVWIIWKATGEYDGSEEEIVKIFSTKDKASSFLKKLIARVEELAINANGNYSHAGDWALQQTLYEEFGRFDYNGISYSIQGPIEVE